MIRTEAYMIDHAIIRVQHSAPSKKPREQKSQSKHLITKLAGWVACHNDQHIIRTTRRKQQQHHTATTTYHIKQTTAAAPQHAGRTHPAAHTQQTTTCMKQPTANNAQHKASNQNRAPSINSSVSNSAQHSSAQHIAAAAHMVDEGRHDVLIRLRA